jgi:hypothetical protein
MKNPKEEKCTCKEHDSYCCQIHGNCPTCVKKEELKQEQEVCNRCGKTLREQMKGCGEITCYRQLLPKQEKLTYTESAKKEERISNCTMMKRKQKTVEEAAEKEYPTIHEQYQYDAFIEGAEWQAERSYSEEDLISFAHFYFREEFNSTMQNSNKSTDEILQDWFNQFKKK